MQEWKHSTGSHARTLLWPCRLWLAAADSPSNRYRGWTPRPESSSRCSDAAPAAGCRSSLWTPSAHPCSQLCWCPHDDRLWIKKIALNIVGNKCGWVLLPAAHTFVIHGDKNKESPSIELQHLFHRWIMHLVLSQRPPASSVCWSRPLWWSSCLSRSPRSSLAPAPCTPTSTTTPIQLMIISHRVMSGVNRHKIVRLYATFYINTWFTDFTFTNWTCQSMQSQHFGTWRPSVSEKGNDREIRH